MWIVQAFAFHILCLGSIFVIYFRSPVLTGLDILPDIPIEAPAKRLVLFVTDGLRSSSFFEDNGKYIPNLKELILKQGMLGLSHTHVPTESRPGHIAMIAGLYEDPSAVTRGWKDNPIDFDSVFNRSQFTWAWGAHDILSIFSKSTKNIEISSYNHDLDFSGKEKTLLLDEWVFKRVSRFLEGNEQPEIASKNKIVFFLHLLGLDSAGHIYKPSTENFYENLNYTQEKIVDIYRKFENYFTDNKTVYILTSDHGMTNSGAHGAGNTHETETPLYIWGAGVKNWKNIVGEKKTERKFRTSSQIIPLFEVEQAAIAPLMSSLIGVAVPRNNYGKLPDHALEILFEPTNGTLGFLHQTIKERKFFVETNVIILNLWIKILQLHGKKINFESHVEGIIECCIKYIISNQTSAKEKEKSTIVLQELFLNELTVQFDTSEVVQKLLDIFNLKNRPGTFIQQVFKLLGIISRDSPESVSNVHSIEIRDVILKTLEDTILNEEGIQNNALAGAMEGFNYYLCNYSPSLDLEPLICNRIYVCVKKLADPPDFVKQKAPFRAALDVFTNHSILFTSQIFRDYKFWQLCFDKWMSKTYEDRRKGIYAMQTFHRVIEQEISKRKEPNDAAILEFFIQKFIRILESPISKQFETRIAIRGIGVMALSCKTYLKDLLQNLISLVIQRTELISIAEDNELKDSLEHFPDYIQALSQIILHMEDINVAYSLSHNVQNIAIRLIRDFHYLSRVHTNLAANSLCNAFFNLSEVDGSLLNDTLEKIVFQGVIWTCSHKLTFDANIDWETNIDWKDNVTFKNYLPLWEAMLDEVNQDNTCQILYDKALIARHVFDHLISTLFIILDKLDLRTKRRVFTKEDGTDQEFYFCDPNIDLIPEKTKDYHIFFNLVQFYREIFFSKYRRANFRVWINKYCSKIIEYSIKNPLVSGFFKLLEYGLSAADHLEYFTENICDNSEFLDNQLINFFQIILVKAQTTSGELQISILELLLRYPIKFCENFLFELIEIFHISFTLGKSLPWLAKLAIIRLDKICEHFSQNINEIKTFYERVLPNLDSYLQSKGFVDDIQPEIIQYKNSRRIRRNFFKKSEPNELFEVQKLIVEFLGKLDPDNALLLISQSFKENLVKFNIDNNICLKLYFNNMQLDLYFDTIVPRICDLAKNSSDRKTRIAACEIVHALILYMLGSRNNEGVVWKELCSVIIILGADSDTTVQQMFMPLLMQLLHFMSKYENIDRGVDSLMEALIDGISNNSNSSARDLSAICLREFVEWSIKQTTPEQLAASPVSIEKILEQLRLNSFDSKNSRRIGAALAFNNLYRILREEEAICDVFFIDLLYTFCCNFKLSEELNTSTNLLLINADLEQISASLDHVVRVLKEKSYLYNKLNKNRKIPNAIGSEAATLIDVILFLLKESDIKLLNYRRKCLKIVEELSKNIESNVDIFLSKHATFEILQNITKVRKTLAIDSKISNPHLIAYNWLQYFLCSLDLHSWLLKHNNSLNKQLLPENIPEICEAITYYFEKICWNSMIDIFIEIDPNYLNDFSDSILQSNLEEIQKINSIKYFICTQILIFFNAIIPSEYNKYIKSEFWSNNAQYIEKILIQIIFEPHLLKFNLEEEKILPELQKKILVLINNLKKYCLHFDFVKVLIKKMRFSLINHIKELTDQSQQILNSQQITEKQLNSATGILFIIQNSVYFNYDLNTENFLNISAVKLLNDLYISIHEIIHSKKKTLNIPPDVKIFGSKLIKIAFKIGDIENELIDYLMDEEELIQYGMQTKIKYGEWFYNVYKTGILENCKASFLKTFLPKLISKITMDNFYYVMKILCDIIEFSFKYRQHDQETLSELVETLLNNSKHLLTNEQFMNKNKIFIIVEYLINLEVACPKDWNSKLYSAKCPELYDWILNQLKDNSSLIQLEQRSRIFSLLPLILNDDDFEKKEVTEALEYIQHNYFPLKSSEFKENSLEETKLKAAYKNLLDAMISSKSFIILEFILKSTAADKKHLVEYMIREDLKIFINNLGEQNQCETFKRIFKFICCDNIEPEIRLTVLHRFLVPVIENSSETTIKTVYTENFPQIIRLTEKKYGFANSGWLVEHALVDRIIGFTLIELFFVLLRKEDYYFKDSPIIQKAFPGEKLAGDFISSLSKKSFYSRKDIFITDDRTAAEYFRLYQCSSYKAICSIVCNTQTDMKFYKNLIFSENPKNNEYIWQKMINCTDENIYNFQGQEFEKVPKIKQRFVSIRKMNDNADSNRNTVISAKYMQTQNVFASSLSQDINKIDLNYSMVRSDADKMARMELQSKKLVCVSLERNILNKHEIMPTLCGVIQHMHDNDITPRILDPSAKRSYPWIVSIANVIENYQTPKNVRVFLTQLVDNCRHVFKPFAHILYKPILEVLCDECAGNKINFFVTDLTTLLLSWSKQNLHNLSNANEIRLASKLIEFLMKNVWHNNKKIYKFNLELIQTAISLWKNCISIPTELLNIMISNQNTNSKHNECGITLIGIVLSNNLNPWKDNVKIFGLNIFSNLNNDFSSIYQPAAHVLGIMLNILKKNENSENLEYFQTEIINKLKGLLNKRENKKEKIFIDILYSVHKSYPKIIDSFRVIISFKIPTAIGSIKRIYLEMLLTRLESYDAEEVYNIIISIGILDLLKHLDYQMLALHIVNKSLPKLQENELFHIYPAIENCANSSNAECRDVCYEILIFMSKIDSNNSKKFKKSIQNLLVKALVDKDSQIQKRVFQFWSNESNLPNEPTERIKTLFSHFDSKNQNEFLGFFTQLMLELPIRKPESKNQLFQFEIDRDYKLEEYEINTSSRIRSPFSLPPLFAESQQKYTLLAHTQMSNFIRATQGNDFFEPTQNPEKLLSNRTNFTLPSERSSLFGIQPQILDRRSQKIPSKERSEDNENNDNSLNKFRNRFIRDHENQQRQIALSTIDLKYKKSAFSENKKTDKKVTLYRRYRIGDYPDLLINSLAFLLPLQALVQRDSVIERQIFVSIFNAILKTLPTREAEEFIMDINNRIQNIFENMKYCDSTVFGAFTEIALLKADKINFNPKTIATIANANNMLTIGAIFLENLLNSDCLDETIESRSVRSTATITNYEECWLQLSDIYTSLGEFDIVAAIFGDKMDTDSRLSVAIECKANGFYERAQFLLRQIIERDRLLEHYYAYGSYYECYMELCDWSCLSKEIKHQIDDYEELWTDEYNTKFLLPKLIQAELNLILCGESISSEFLNKLQNWMTDPIKAESIQATFCEQMMMFQIANKDFKQARVFGENHLKKFLIEWGVTSVDCLKLRTQKLLNAQKVAEIDQCAVMLIENINNVNIIKSLNKKWLNCSIKRSDSLRHWNSVLCYRTYISSIVIENLQNLSSQNLEIVNLKKTIYDMYLLYFKAAYYQKNYGIAKKIVQILKPLEDMNFNNLKLEYETAKIQLILLKSEKIMDISSLDCLEQAFLATQKTLENENLNESAQIQLDLLNLNSVICVDIAKINQVMQINNRFTKNLILVIGEKHSDYANINDLLFKESVWSEQKSHNILNEILNNSQKELSLQNENLYGENFYKVAQFSYDHYQHKDFQTSLQLRKLLIGSVFNAMKYNSLNARQLFPCVLSIPGLDWVDESNNLQETFIENSNNVPDWMFLSWIPQIFSHIKLNKESYLDHIIIRLAKSYPNALRYPFNVWYDREQSLENRDTINVRDNVLLVIDLLKSPLTDKFIRGMKSLKIPQVTLLNELIKFSKIKSPEKLFEALKTFNNSFFEENKEFQGTLFKKITPIQKKLEKILKEFFTVEFREIGTELIKLTKELQSMKNFQTTQRLENLVPWLAQFHWCGNEEYIEMPGQYTGDNRPILEAHIKIVRFVQKVEIFKSQRSPIRLTMCASNGKNYDFVFKYGEDLRQDQRIQQILKIMSDKLNQDLQCRNHQLFIKTYKVVSFDQNCGILSWVYDTTTIMSFIKNCLARQKANAVDTILLSRHKHTKFFLKPCRNRFKNNDFLHVYGTAVMHYTRAEIAMHFRELEYMIPAEIIKQALIELSISPESFYVLRNNYATSLATMNIAHWILGIGDRHLENILISTKDGSLTGIDFGDAFGAATRNKGVPELFPFRLTPHFINVMDPMGSSGLIFKCMAHSLRVFRQSKKNLLACMEVFVRDPTIDWIESNEKYDEADSEITSNWEPKDRLDVAKCKLEGYNPKHILERELNDCRLALLNYKDYLKAYIKLVQGEHQFNIRARLDEKDLSVEDQIKCLIDLATDPAILGSAYEGLLTWI